MSLEELKAAPKKTIGAKQTTKAIEKGIAQMVFVAADADDHVVRDVVKACKDRGVSLASVDSMAALGKACGIEVGAATAAILDPQASKGGA